MLARRPARADLGFAGPARGAVQRRPQAAGDADAPAMAAGDQRAISADAQPAPDLRVGAEVPEPGRDGGGVEMRREPLQAGERDAAVSAGQQAGADGARTPT